MEHQINSKLPVGSYQIICTSCGEVKGSGFNDFTQASIVTLNYSETCSKCGGKVILETNPIETKNKYDKDHPYIDNCNEN